MAIFRPFLASALVAYSTVAYAVPLEERAAAVCASGIYGELAPILAPYSIAQAYCTAVFPVSCTTKVNARRGQASTTTTTKKATTTTKSVSSVSTSTTVDTKSSAWSKCQAQPASVISTLCSCIEVPATCKVTTTTTTPSPTTTTTTTTPSPTTTTTTTTPSPTTTTTTTTSPSAAASASATSAPPCVGDGGSCFSSSQCCPGSVTSECIGDVAAGLGECLVF